MHIKQCVYALHLGPLRPIGHDRYRNLLMIRSASARPSEASFQEKKTEFISSYKLIKISAFHLFEWVYTMKWIPPPFLERKLHREDLLAGNGIDHNQSNAQWDGKPRAGKVLFLHLWVSGDCLCSLYSSNGSKVQHKAQVAMKINVTFLYGGHDLTLKQSPPLRPSSGI